MLGEDDAERQPKMPPPHPRPATFTPEDIGMLSLMNTQARFAVNDVGNHVPPKYPLLYWGNKPVWDCARLLVLRSETVMKYAAVLPTNHLAMKYGNEVRLCAQAEK